MKTELKGKATCSAFDVLANEIRIHESKLTSVHPAFGIIRDRCMSLAEKLE